MKGTESSWKSRKILPAGALLLLAFFPGCAPAPPRPPAPEAVPLPPPAGTAAVEGRIFLSGNIGLTGPVSIRAAGVSGESSPTGKYALAGLPEGKAHLTAETRVNGTRYLGVAVLILEKGRTLSRDLELGDASNVDAYCLDCHPFKGEQTRRDQIVRDLHASGIRPKKAVANRDGTMLDERGYVTCESCHTVHEETGVGQFVRYPFRNGELCIRCHS